MKIFAQCLQIIITIMIQLASNFWPQSAILFFLDHPIIAKPFQLIPEYNDRTPALHFLRQFPLKHFYSNDFQSFYKRNHFDTTC